MNTARIEPSTLHTSNIEYNTFQYTNNSNRTGTSGMATIREWMQPSEKMVMVMSIDSASQQPVDRTTPLLLPLTLGDGGLNNRFGSTSMLDMETAMAQQILTDDSRTISMDSLINGIYHDAGGRLFSAPKMMAEEELLAKNNHGLLPQPEQLTLMVKQWVGTSG